jgi:alpha-N-arabinofuranosidase
MDAYNTFENPEVVKEEEFTGYTVSENGISFEIPACSVVQFRVK